MANVLFKLAILAIVLSVNAQRAAAQTQIKMLRPLLTRNTFATTPQCDPVTKKRQCHNDCKTLLICDGINEDPTNIIECSSPSPYCSDGKCQADKPNACLSTGKTCPGINKYYPDLNSCLVAYPCDDKGKSEPDEVCPINIPFDFNLQDCRVGAPCALINCVGKKYASHPTYPTLNVLCQDGKPIESTYIECTEGYQFGPSLDCEFKCTKQGSFANINDLSKKTYFSCLPSGPSGSLVAHERKCAGKNVFDPKERKCVEPPAPAPEPEPPATG